MCGINTSEEDCRSAIDAMLEYEKKLIEIADNMQAAIKQTQANLQGDENVKNINERLQGHIINIHNASLKAKDISKKLSVELNDIIQNTIKSV